MRLLISLLCATSLGWCAPQDTVWTRKFGATLTDFAQGATPDLSGGFIATGTYQHPAPSPRGSDLFVTRVDGATGDTLYFRTFGGNASDNGADVYVDALQTLVVGTTSSFGSNPSNAYLIALDSDGDSLWTRSYDLGGGEAGFAVKRSTSGDYYIGGWTTLLGNQDFMLLKIDSTGALLWSRTLGGAQIDMGFDVHPLADGGCLIAGATGSYGTGSPPRSNGWLLRYDSAGDTVWSRIYGTSALDERILDIEPTLDGGYLLTGDQEDPLGDMDIFVVNIDANGIEEWSQVFGGTGDDGAQSATVDCDLFLVAGFTTSYGAGGRDGYLLLLDQSGDSLWSATMGGTLDDFFYAVNSLCTPTYHAGYLAAGYTRNGAVGPQDAWLVRLANDPRVEFTSPLPCDRFVVGQTINATWFHEGFEGFPDVSLELNRDYPNGAWEMINASFVNAGSYSFAATLPASNSCRLRLTKLGGAPGQWISDEFSVLPLGTLQQPVMDWDSSYLQPTIRELEYVERDRGFAYPLGRAIHKRDSLGGALWEYVSPLSYFDYDVSSGPICELGNGDLLSLLTVDTTGPLNPSWVAVLRCDSVGNGVSINAGGRPSSRSAGGVEICPDNSGGFWVVAQTYPEGGGFAPLPAVLHYPQDNIVQLVDMFFCFATCGALADSGILIAAYSGDPFNIAQDVHLIKVNETYDTLWTRTYDLGENEYPVRLLQLSHGNYLLLGQMSPYIGGSYRSFYLELDAEGDTVRSWIYSDRDNTQMYGLAEDMDGRIVSCGTTNFVSQQRDFLLTKFDCDGELVWELPYGGANSETFYDVVTTADLGYMATGSRFFPSGPGLGDDRGTAVKFGPETYYQPPACLPADSLVIRYDATMNANVLTWVGPEQGAYFIYTSAVYDSLFPSGNWSQAGCTAAGPPPAASVMSWTDFNVTPDIKFYRVVHGCNQSCGGGEN